MSGEEPTLPPGEAAEDHKREREAEEVAADGISSVKRLRSDVDGAAASPTADAESAALGGPGAPAEEAAAGGAATYVGGPGAGAAGAAVAGAAVVGGAVPAPISYDAAAAGLTSIPNKPYSYDANAAGLTASPAAVTGDLASQVLKLLVPEKETGNVIGRGGERLKEIRTATGSQT